MNVIIDLSTKKVKSTNRKKDLFEFEVELLTNDVQKTIDGKTINLLENPSAFNFEDVIKIKEQQILDSESQESIILYEKLDEKDLDLSHQDNATNTGFKFLQIKPKGQCITKAIEIKPSTTISIYLESEEGIETEYSIDGEEFSKFNKVINLTKESTQLYLKFINTSEQPKEIFSYGILI